MPNRLFPLNPDRTLQFRDLSVFNLKLPQQIM